ncbi:MAG: hypothetical protein SOR91_04050 [Hornefia butyriciproducens]|uniref:hypothetical protein n=1 Tax=Hornefia butyriciproducens TaxID=2652293 RepID=UPI002A757887|nr:hypothetical protein [Hornefia butyriciproducens]MDY2990629.1 hypothetical protein [Hornefia butyriciproducens]
MMQRVVIRNLRSDRKVKPRVFDALVEDNVISFEIKNGKNNEVIPLTDVLEQIEKAKETTEP